ncbi:hypothetical protein pb186bvf_008218 [Paramecium bursaria]
MDNQSIFLCALFESRAIPEIKSFFSGFRRAQSKLRGALLKITENALYLYAKECTSQCFKILNEKIIQQIKMNNPQSGEKQIILFFKDFDSLVQAVNQLVQNPKDARIYLELIDEQLFLTVMNLLQTQWSFTRHDETVVMKSAEVDIMNNDEYPDIEIVDYEPIIMIPTWILNQCAQIAVKNDTSFRINFYMVHEQYSLEFEVNNTLDLPKYRQYFIAQQAKKEELKNLEVIFFFQIQISFLLKLTNYFVNRFVILLPQKR